MKHFSLAKLAAALLICNIYIFACAAIGTTGAEPLPSAAYEENSEENNNHLGGTMDFIGADDMLTPDKPEESTSTVELENFGFSKPSISQKPVNSQYVPSSSVKDLIENSKPDTPDESDPQPDEVIGGDDTAQSKPESEPTPESKPETKPDPDPTPESKPESKPETTPDPTPESKPESKPETPSESQPESDPEPDVPAPVPNPPPEYSDSEILRVNDNGTEVSGSAVEIIAKIVQNEIGDTFAPEAIKAQAVTAYTYVKYHNLHGSAPYCILSKKAGDSVTVLVQSVIGEAIYYNNELIQAVYSASSAGCTASSQNVWGGYLPYLQSVYCELDEKYDPNYGRKAVFTESEMKQRIYKNAGISLSGDPSKWFTIENRTEGKYVGDMTIGGQSKFVDPDGDVLKATGRRFREIIMEYDIRSSAFDIDYDPVRGEFTITTYGYGHGVGLSQNGANNIAKYWGWDYKRILKFYFQGTEVY